MKNLKKRCWNYFVMLKINKYLFHQDAKPSGVIIERMRSEDTEGVLSIVQTVPANPWSWRMLVEEMANPLSHCFVMREERNQKQTTVAGFICFRNIGEESELFNIAVHPFYRNKGIGKKLMEFYIDFSIKTGIHRFYLEVNPSNSQAIHLYQGFAFQSFGKRRNFYQGKLDALLMMRST